MEQRHRALPAAAEHLEEDRLGLEGPQARIIDTVEAKGY